MNRKTLVTVLIVVLVISTPATAALTNVLSWTQIWSSSEGTSYGQIGPNQKYVVAEDTSGGMTQLYYDNGTEVTDYSTGNADDIAISINGTHAIAADSNSDDYEIIDLESQTIVTQTTPGENLGAVAKGPVISGKQTFYVHTVVSEKIYWVNEDGTVLDSNSSPKDARDGEYSEKYNATFWADLSGDVGVIRTEANLSNTYRINTYNSGGSGEGIDVSNETGYFVTQNAKLVAFHLKNGTKIYEKSVPMESGTTEDVEAVEEIDRVFVTDNSGQTVVYYTNGTEIGNYSDGGGAIDQGTVNGKISLLTVSGNANLYETEINSPFSGGGGTTTVTNLEIEIDNWQSQKTNQSYQVFLNETNTTTGNVNRTEVTDTANVTIYNVTNTSGFSTPIVTVNNSSDQLRSYNETGKVVVNATWNGETADGNTENLTVGPRNLSNIGIMPPSQWVPSFLEVDDTTGGHNIGSSMQWVWFIIFIMAAAARMFENPWVGVGSGMVTAVLLWVLTYVSLGMMLSTQFAGILIGLIMSRASMGHGEVTGTSDREFQQ